MTKKPQTKRVFTVIESNPENNFDSFKDALEDAKKFTRDENIPHTVCEILAIVSPTGEPVVEMLKKEKTKK